jgi:iron complex outermembrane receptor protein
MGAAAALVTATTSAVAQDTLAKLPATITVTRGVGRSTLDLPFGIASITADSARPGQTHLLVDETLFQLPGLTVANRFNPSQDTRISIRGFGARSQFGARSIRILRDGMPLTLPDGQTPIDYLDLESVGQVEVLRGTAAALYGNASGGVIDLRSPPPPTAHIAPEVRWFTGSNGLERETALVGGTVRSFWYQANAGHTTADNARQYSEQQLTNGYLRAGTTVKGTVLTVTGLGLDMPKAQNPGAVTLAQAEGNPTGADSLSVVRKARKEVQQIQVGLSATRDFARDQTIVVQVYDGRRALYNPLTSNVVDVKRRLNGGSLRFTGLTLALARALHVDSSARYTVGYDYQWFGDDRLNWAPCDGITKVSVNCPTLPAEKGILQLDQREIVGSSGLYAREDVDIQALRLTAGVRNDQVGFTLHDHFLGDGRDDSGSRTLRSTNPILGVGLRVTRFHSLYANYSTAFETPTTTEFGNHADGTAGLNPDLKPQTSHTVEAGIKGLAMSRLVYDASLYDTHVHDELIPYEVATGGGRTYYRNAGATRRRGAEIAASTTVGRLDLSATYALSEFHFVHDSVSATVRNDGNVIPGVPERQAQVSSTWRGQHYFVVGEWTAKSAITVNDANTASAPGFAIVNLRAGGTLGRHGSVVAPMFGVQNLFDRRYISSVAVNAVAASAKYYEPGGGRSFFGGLQIRP